MVREIRDKNLFELISNAVKEIGIKPIAAFFILFFLVIAGTTTFFLTQNRQTITQQAAPAQNNPNRITYLGADWYLHGANVPWYNWACDFGCNQNGGVSGNTATLRGGFQKLKNAGMHTARWWVFPGDAWQITRDAQGMPTGLNQSIYADFDAALALAEEYDLYYNFVLFSSSTSIPSSWILDASQRAKLAEVLGTLFARYGGNPRVMSWEIFNEPEFQIWNNEIAQAPVVDTVKAISDSVHANSGALTTVGGAMLDGIPMWKDTGIDYYSPHWYDYMGSGGWCARCTDYNEVKNRFGINKPVVIGELYIGTDTDSLQRFNDFYNKGFAGAWPWSLFPDRTSDNLGIDFNAAKTFSSTKTDLGPKQVISPTPATPAPSLTPTSTPMLSPTKPPRPTPTAPTPTITPTLPSATPTILVPTSTSTPIKTGDLNKDNKVDILDLSYMLSRWKTNDTVSDLNHDGNVSILDLSMLLSNWDK